MMTAINVGDWNPPPVTNAFPLTEDTDGVPLRAIQIRASGAGTVTLLLAGGTALDVDVPEGTSIFPYSVQRATVGSATIVSYTNLS